MKKLKIAIIGIMLVVGMIGLAGCALDETSSTNTITTKDDVQNTLNTGNRLTNNQPTPTDIDYSLERYNLIRRAYWVNGKREKANTLVCNVDKPLGYIALFLENGSCAGKFIVDGKVSSLNSYLTPDSEYYSGEATNVYGVITSGEDKSDINYSCVNRWLPDVDGSYGENDKGIFFFTPDGKYIEWTGTYLYSDIPFEVKDVVVTYKEAR